MGRMDGRTDRRRAEGGQSNNQNQSRSRAKQHPKLAAINIHLYPHYILIDPSTQKGIRGE